MWIANDSTVEPSHSFPVSTLERFVPTSTPYLVRVSVTGAGRDPYSYGGVWPRLRDARCVHSRSTLGIDFGAW